MTRGGSRRTTEDIGDLTGSVIVVTGANSGVGYQTALTFAVHGSHVVLGCRNLARARASADRILKNEPSASIETLELDLSDLSSVHRSASEFRRRHDRLDVLVNNAGVMATPPLVTPDGLERQWATNHLGPFAFTGLLLDRLATTDGSRVVTVSSGLHRFGHVSFSEIRSGLSPRPWSTYAATKRASLLFTSELARRLGEAGVQILALAAHPGWARTSLAANGPALGVGGIRRRAARLASGLGQSPERGALPILYAATAGTVRGGEYFGPGGLAELFGPPIRIGSRAAGRTAEAELLWETSEELTGVRYDFEAPRTAFAAENVHVEATRGPGTSGSDAVAGGGRG